MSEVRLKVIPGAREDEVVGWQENVLRLRVRAKPERGRANDAVCRLLARVLGVPRTNVSIARGAGSRDKLVVIDGLDDEELRRRVAAPIA